MHYVSIRCHYAPCHHLEAISWLITYKSYDTGFNMWYPLKLPEWARTWKPASQRYTVISCAFLVHVSQKADLFCRRCFRLSWRSLNIKKHQSNWPTSALTAQHPMNQMPVAIDIGAHTDTHTLEATTRHKTS